MFLADFHIKKFVPLLIMLITAFCASLWFAHEGLSITSSVMLAGCVALIGSVHLARAYQRKRIENGTPIIGINFVLTTVLAYFLLRVLADFVVPVWS